MTDLFGKNLHPDEFDHHHHVQRYNENSGDSDLGNGEKGVLGSNALVDSE